MIISTFSNKEEAKKISKILLKERLVACANIIPEIESLYWWKEEIQEEKEVIAYFKTKKKLERVVIARIKELHSYDVPAIYAIESMELIYEPYREWVEKETKEE